MKKQRKTIGILFNPEKERARKEASSLASWLNRHACRGVLVADDTAPLPRLDFALSLGGDGTMLRASRRFAPAGIPVLGVNLGSLGFLAETNPEELRAFLVKILRAGFLTEDRLMLAVTACGECTLALNDCTIHSGASNRVIRIAAEHGREFLTEYVGDGLIVSTPTGSTAYSLAASGPIVHPSVDVVVITPVCPHTLTQRPMILAPRPGISLTVTRCSNQVLPVLSIDGQQTRPLKPGDRVEIVPAQRRLRLIVNPQRRYFSVLRAKLKWGERG